MLVVARHTEVAGSASVVFYNSTCAISESLRYLLSCIHFLFSCMSITFAIEGKLVYHFELVKQQTSMFAYRFLRSNTSHSEVHSDMTLIQL